MMWRELFVPVVLLASFYSIGNAVAGTCTKPQITSSTLVVDDAIFHFSTVFVVEFVLKCQNDVKDLPIYAEVNGRLLPTAIALDSSRYQVSWTSEHEKAVATTYNINLHTEDGYAAIRKAQRNKESLDNVKPLATVTIDHGGSSKGPWIQTQMIAVVIAGAIWYYAYTLKSQLLS